MELYSNANTIYSTLGGSTNGHLALMMPDMDYLAHASQANDIPVHPGPQLPHLAGTAGAQIVTNH